MIFNYPEILINTNEIDDSPQPQDILIFQIPLGLKKVPQIKYKKIINEKLLPSITELYLDYMELADKDLFTKYEFPSLKKLNLREQIFNYLPSSVEDLTIDGFHASQHQFDEIINVKSLTIIDNRTLEKGKITIITNFNYNIIENLSYDARQFHLLDFASMPNLKTLYLKECDQALPPLNLIKYSGYTGWGELPHSITDLSYVVRNFCHIPVRLNTLTLTFFESNTGVIICECETLKINCYTDMSYVKLAITGVEYLTVSTLFYHDNVTFINNLISQYDLLSLFLNNKYYIDSGPWNNAIRYACNINIPSNLIELFYHDSVFSEERIIRCKNLIKCELVCKASKIILNTPVLRDLQIYVSPSFSLSCEYISQPFEVIYETDNVLNSFTTTISYNFDIDFSQINTQYIKTIVNGTNNREGQIILPKCSKHEVQGFFDNNWIHSGLEILIVNNLDNTIDAPSLKKLYVKDISLLDKIIVSRDCEIVIADSEV